MQSAPSNERLELKRIRHLILEYRVLRNIIAFQIKTLDVLSQGTGWASRLQATPQDEFDLACDSQLVG